MFPLTVPQWIAAGNINPCRFIAPSGANFTAGQASASSCIPVGVSFEETRYPPGLTSDDGLVAIAGESIPYYPPLSVGHLMVGVGGATFASLLVSDASGKGVIAPTGAGNTTNVWIGAISLGNGVANDKVPVWVLPPTPFRAVLS